MRSRALAACVLAAAVILGPGFPTAGAEEPAHILLRLDSADDDISIDAELEWEDLEEAAQLVLLRDALHSDDASLARSAARRLDPSALDLAGVQRQAAVLSTVPGWVVGRYDGADRFGNSFEALGAPELPAALRTFAANASNDAVQSGRDLHRALDTSHIPVLVELLPSENPVAFRTAAWMLTGVAQLTDEHRLEVLRGTLYTLDRLAWERACEELPDTTEPPPAPKLRVLAADALGPRPSAEFLELADAVWTDDRSMWEGGFETDLHAPFHWFQRWAMDLRPTLDDLATLERIATSNPDERAFAWAIRGIASVGRSGSPVTVLQRIQAATDDETGVRWAATAAWLARLGERDTWNLIAVEATRPDLLVDGEEFVLDLEELGIEIPPHDRDYPLETLLWIADPTLAGRAVEVADPSPREREHLRLHWGIEIGPDDVAQLEARRWADPVWVPDLIHFYAAVAPERLGPERGEDLARLLYDIPFRGAAFDTADGSVDLSPILARLEIAAPASLRALAQHWAGRGEYEARRFGFRMLALTATSHEVEAMLRSWPYEWGEDAWALGRVPDPRVREFLHAQLAEASTWEDGFDAVAALLVNCGLPTACSDTLRYDVVDNDSPWDAEPLLSFRRLLVAGDGDAALLHLARETQSERLLPLLGLSATDAARAYLEERRNDPEGEPYWHATLGLALAGDAPATAQIRALFAENRTWMFGNLRHHWRAIATRPAWASWQIDRLTDNCCVRFEAVELLRAVYPTIPLADSRESPIEQRRFAIDWLRTRRERMRWSWIARGLLPVFE